MSFRIPNKQRDSPNSSNWRLWWVKEVVKRQEGEMRLEHSWGRGVAPMDSGHPVLSIIAENNYGDQKKLILHALSQNPLALVAASWGELSLLFAMCPQPRAVGLDSVSQPHAVGSVLLTLLFI